LRLYADFFGVTATLFSLKPPSYEILATPLPAGIGFSRMTQLAFQIWRSQTV